MEFQNSYIFLPKNDKNQPQKDKDLFLFSGLSVFSLLKKEFSFSSNEISQQGYFMKAIRKRLIINKDSYEVVFLIHEVVDKTYLDVIINGKTKAKIVKGLEFINNKLIDPDGAFEKNYILIVSYDAVSEYYCNKVYPKLNQLERTLRKLLFNIYIVDFGEEYYSKASTQEFQDKVKSIIQAKGNSEKRKIEYIKLFFYALDYKNIQTLLFEEKWTNLEEREKNTFLEKNEDLSELKDSQLREAFNNFSPKSDWERFFSSKTDINAIELIEDIRLLLVSIKVRKSHQLLRSI